MIFYDKRAYLTDNYAVTYYKMTTPTIFVVGVEHRLRAYYSIFFQ